MFKNMMIALLLAIVLCTDLKAEPMPLTDPIITKVNVIAVLRSLDFGKRVEYIKPISNTEFLITMCPDTFPSYVGKYADKVATVLPNTTTIFSVNDFNLRELTVVINIKN